ncbi:MAG: pilus assembly protein PilP [Gammaproteobacteria bacterium]|nr:pilus assembly protein PilP [Gammaproteobacteria bacterium]
MSKYKLPRQYHAALLSSIVAISLGACSSDISPLHKFVQDAKTKQRPKLQPLPEIKPYETFSYTAGHLKDPFEPAVIQQSKTVKIIGKGKGPKPVEGRARELLETFPLDALRMVGTLKQKQTLWALIRTNDGTVHRIKTGNYIGQNHGKIIKITEDKIHLSEIVPDGLGDWMERPASVAMENSK